MGPANDRGTETIGGNMDYFSYEVYPFDSHSAFNMSTGYKKRNVIK